MLVRCNFVSGICKLKPKKTFNNQLHCDFASEPPNFDLDDIINRLKKLNVNKSPGPNLIHPRILYETAYQIAYPLKLILKALFIISVCHQNGNMQISHPYIKKAHDQIQEIIGQ